MDVEELSFSKIEMHDCFNPDFVNFIEKKEDSIDGLYKLFNEDTGGKPR